MVFINTFDNETQSHQNRHLNIDTSSRCVFVTLRTAPNCVFGLEKKIAIHNFTRLVIPFTACVTLYHSFLCHCQENNINKICALFQCEVSYSVKEFFGGMVPLHSYSSSPKNVHVT